MTKGSAWQLTHRSLPLVTLSSNSPHCLGLTVPLTQSDPQPQLCPLTHAVVPGHLGFFKSWVCLSPLHFLFIFPELFVTAHH